MTAPGRGGTDGRDGRVVPVYAVTGGRTRSTGRDLPAESLVTATDHWAGDLQKEYRVIIDLASAPVALVEIGPPRGYRSEWRGCR